MKVELNDLVAGLESGQQRLLTMAIVAHRLGQEAQLLGGRSELEDFEPELEAISKRLFESGDDALALLGRALKVSATAPVVEIVD